MNSQILIKINSIIKNRLIELLGILLVLISVFLLVNQVPPFASVYPALASFVHASPGSSPTLPKISTIVPIYSNVIASLPLK